MPEERTSLILAGFRLHRTTTFRCCISSTETNLTRPDTIYAPNHTGHLNHFARQIRWKETGKPCLGGDSIGVPCLSRLLLAKVNLLNIQRVCIGMAVHFDDLADPDVQLVYARFCILSSWCC